VFATDLHQAAVDQARQGIYPSNIAVDVSPDPTPPYFAEEEDGRLRLSKKIREMVILATQDVIRDPPFTRIDLIVCRNLLIYLEPEMQRRLLPLLHHSLNPGGVLFLGSSETIGGLSDLFSPLDVKHRIYRRRTSASHLDASSFPSSYLVPRETAPSILLPPRSLENLSTLAEQALLRFFGRPAVLVNEAGDVLYFSGRTGEYLEPPAGKAHWNVFAMAREGLRQHLFAAVHSATRRKRPVTVTGLRTRGRKPSRRFDLAVSRSRSRTHSGVCSSWSSPSRPTSEERRPGGTPSRQGPPGCDWPNWRRSYDRPPTSCRPPARRCGPRRRSSSPPTRS
jgi:two-component system CheB/CheR fusion protein